MDPGTLENLERSAGLPLSGVISFPWRGGTLTENFQAIREGLDQDLDRDPEWFAGVVANVAHLPFDLQWRVARLVEQKGAITQRMTERERTIEHIRSALLHGAWDDPEWLRWVSERIDLPADVRELVNKALAKMAGTDEHIPAGLGGAPSCALADPEYAEEQVLILRGRR